LDIVKIGSASMVFHGMSEDDVENIIVPADNDYIRLRHPPVWAGCAHPRGYGSNARVLGCYVREKKILRLEDAVRKMTSLPAQKFHITGRGILQPGMFCRYCYL